ncbi:hypothetical protein JW933_09195 [candidate division FCPU426 bacterium]|nr:hypothetical protein [candidate division FCPU426 bacterium]
MLQRTWYRHLSAVAGFSVFCLLSLFRTAPAVWEHAPISDATRLSPDRPAVWEFGMVYDHSALYPAEFYCPGGARVVLHVLNISPVSIKIKRANPAAVYMLNPGAYRRIDFGILPTGEHLFFLDSHMGGDFDPVDGESFEQLWRFKCYIHAGNWPGPMYLYRAAWITHHSRLLPKKTVIPSGRKTDLFIGAPEGSPSLSYQARGCTFAVKSGAVTLTEILNPQSGIIPIPLAPTADAELSIR